MGSCGLLDSLTIFAHLFPHARNSFTGPPRLPRGPKSALDKPNRKLKKNSWPRSFKNKRKRWKAVGCTDSQTFCFYMQPWRIRPCRLCSSWATHTARDGHPRISVHVYTAPQNKKTAPQELAARSLPEDSDGRLLHFHSQAELNLAVATKKNRNSKTCGLPLRSFNFEPHPNASGCKLDGIWQSMRRGSFRDTRYYFLPRQKKTRFLVVIIFSLIVVRPPYWQSMCTFVQLLQSFVYCNSTS